MLEDVNLVNPFRAEILLGHDFQRKPVRMEKKNSLSHIGNTMDSDDLASRDYISDVMMGAMASQITGISFVYSTVCSSWPWWGEFTGDRGIPLTKVQWRGKCFHCWRHHEGTNSYDIDVVLRNISVEHQKGFQHHCLHQGPISITCIDFNPIMAYKILNEIT